MHIAKLLITLKILLACDKPVNHITIRASYFIGFAALFELETLVAFPAGVNKSCLNWLILLWVLIAFAS
jgi:hypothetical protein